MAYSFCPFCSAVIADPAWRFCPSCGGRFPEDFGQECPAAPVAGLRRGISAIVVSAGFLLILVIAAIFLHAFAIHWDMAPATANAGTLPSPSVLPGISDSAGNVTTYATISALNSTIQNSGPETPVNTTLTITVLYRTPEYSGPVITVSGSSPYSYQAPAMGSSPHVPVINTTSLAARVHELVNKVRQENGRPVLGTDVRLAAIARAHSSDMAAHGYFGHVNLREMDPTARGAAAGYTCHKDYETYYTYGIAENLFATYRYSSVLFRRSSAADYDWKTEEAVAEETVDAWLNSPEHRENLLATGVDREGIGVAISTDDLVFVTEDFC